MYRWTLVLGMALALAAPAMAADRDEIRIAVEGAYPPFSEVTPSGDLAGFDIDIAKALCAQMEVECELVQQDWDGIIPALLAGRYDAIVASMTITPERKERVDFTDKYYSNSATFVRKKGSGVELDDLAGKRIGVQRATTHDQYVSEAYGDSAEIVRYGTQEEANLDMLAGRLVLLLADTVALQEGFLKTPEGADYEPAGPDLTDPRWFGEGVGIALRQDDDELRERFNEAIAAILADGTYDAIQGKYFDFDIYGARN